MADQEFITVTVGEDEAKQEFNFKVPSPRDLARLGMRAKALRAKDDPESGGEEYGLDPLTSDLYRGCALLETLLKTANCKDNWVYSTGPDGKPVVDSEKFPAEQIANVQEVYRRFIAAVNTFLAGFARP